jgi:thymidylate synthase
MLARNHSPSSITKLYISTNIRSRLIQPSIPMTYFGNAIMFSYLEMNISELTNTNNLGFVASQVHQAIKANTNDDIRTTLAWIVDQIDKTKITPTFDLNERDFTISAWNKMGMYTDSDFEIGMHPCRIILPLDTKFNGAAILLSTEINDTSIDVVLGLEINEMERLEMNSDFRKYRGVCVY